MKNVRVLDCTLRDGGRIIDCAFPDGDIRAIASGLADAKIDIIEVGFLRDARKVEYRGGSTFFTDVDQIRPFVDKTRRDVLYVAFIDYGMFDFSTLKPCDGTSVDGIRFGFTKKDYVEHREDVVRCIETIKERGYLAFVQGVNSLNYSDRELLEIVDMVNGVHPYSFGIVDTYGAMYIEDVDRIFGLIDHNMLPDICVNFHSHNNYQLSFGFAQEVIRLSRGSRKVIIDGTLGGMGKVAGNLSTELLVNYMVEKLRYGYELDVLLDLYDNYIYKYTEDHSWGYSVPAMMAGVYKSHPNNVIYLTEKFRLDTKDIGNILALIDPEKRQRYDYDNIERIYAEYASRKIDDVVAMGELRSKFSGREVVVLVPGASLAGHMPEVERYAEQHDALVVSVNFVSDLPGSYSFFGNQKRYGLLREERRGARCILSSNVRPDNAGEELSVNYHSLVERGHRFADNSAIMLLNLLKRLDVSGIALAGLDGFDVDAKENYSDASFQNSRHAREFEDLNEDLASMLTEIRDGLSGRCSLASITPSRFDEVLAGAE